MDASGGGDSESQSRTARARQRAAATAARGAAATRRGRDRLVQDDVSTRHGMLVAWRRRYQEVEGPLQSVLLTTFVFLAIIPALFAMADGISGKATAVAEHVSAYYGLSGTTQTVLRGVLVGGKTHRDATTLLAVAAALLFGRPFGRVLEVVPPELGASTWVRMASRTRRATSPR